MGLLTFLGVALGLLTAVTSVERAAASRWGTHPLYAHRAVNGWVGDFGETVDLERRARERQDVRRGSARQQTMKRQARMCPPVLVRLCWSQGQAVRIERRMVLALSMLCRLGRLVGLRARWLGSTEHNRRPVNALEGLVIGCWLCWYVWVGLFWRSGWFVTPWQPDSRGSLFFKMAEDREV